MKSLYSILKAGNHWFTTYHKYYRDKLEMRELTYNPYFFYRSGLFNIVGMQINNTLILADNDFVSKEEVVIKVAKIMTKGQKHLTSI